MLAYRKCSLIEILNIEANSRLTSVKVKSIVQHVLNIQPVGCLGSKVVIHYIPTSSWPKITWTYL